MEMGYRVGLPGVTTGPHADLHRFRERGDVGRRPVNVVMINSAPLSDTSSAQRDGSRVHLTPPWLHICLLYTSLLNCMFVQSLA